MLVVRSTHEILNNPWDDIPAIKIIPSQIPIKNNNKINFNDVVMWEEIFYEGGNIGVYAAWSPYADFYIIVHNLFLSFDNGIEMFSGNKALDDLLTRLADFDITRHTDVYN
jgi:hypothetical protein